MSAQQQSGDHGVNKLMQMLELNAQAIESENGGEQDEEIREQVITL